MTCIFNVRIVKDGMRFGAALLIAAAAGSALGARQDTPPPSPLRVFADSIPGSIPSDLAADLLLQVGGSGTAKKESQGWRRQLYEQTFALAGGAQEPVKRRQLPRSHTDTRPGMIVMAHRYPIDALSLKTRAVLGQLPLDASRAFELADSIGVTIPPADCREELVADPRALYDAAIDLLKSTAGKPVGDRAYGFLERQILSVSSSTEVSFAIRAALTPSLLTADQSQALLVALAARLRSLRDDDVAFSTYLPEIWQQVWRALDAPGVQTAGVTLLESFRDYLVAHLSGERCTPIGLAREAMAEQEKSVLGHIDDTLALQGLPRLTRAERTPLRVSTAATIVEFWKSSVSSALFRDVKALRVAGGSGTPSSTVQKESPEWKEQLARFYTALEAWKPSDEPSEADYFHERCILLDSLMILLPDGPERDRALGEYIRYLRAEGRQRLGDLEWAFWVRILIDRHRDSTSEHEWVLKALAESGDPVMTLYAQAEQLLTGTRKD